MPQRLFKHNKTGIAVAAAGTTTLDTIYPWEGTDILWMEVSNTNDKALDAFSVELQPHSNASFHIVADVLSDFTVPNAPVEYASADLTALASGAVGLLALDTRAVYAWRFKASSASPSTIIAIRWEAR